MKKTVIKHKKNKLKRLCPMGTTCFLCQQRQGITVKECKEYLNKLKLKYLDKINFNDEV